MQGECSKLIRYLYVDIDGKTEHFDEEITFSQFRDKFNTDTVDILGYDTKSPDVKSYTEMRVTFEVNSENADTIIHDAFCQHFTKVKPLTDLGST
ncbi:MAG: hypothetical protein INQ03_07960 [Candidatus Heimdallarchaeota archaeon]|nr:hypothetical protein [Candidatus Heimdallarchaeota archaeon]